MRNANNPVNRAGLLAGFFCAVLMAFGVPGIAEEEAAGTDAIRTFDNLVPVGDPKVAMAYIDPDADFSVFRRVAVLEPLVSFRANWQRDQNRSRSRNISSRDMERIKADVATQFERVFTERLEDAGYEVVDVMGEDVMILRPAIIDLDITAPDNRTAGRSRTFTSSTGAATLYIELFDGLSGDIIGRAADRQTVRSPGGTVSWSNSVTNTADARRLFGRWADQLISFLDQHYK